MSVLRVLSHRGDDRYQWDAAAVETGDPEAQAAVEEAERIFAQQRSLGATALRVRSGAPAEKIDEFDREAEQIVMVPRVVGG